MSIAQLKKLTLIGQIKDKTCALKHVQMLGCMHLIPLSNPPAELEKAATPNADKSLKALRFLNTVANPRKQVRRDPNFDVQLFTKTTLELQQKTREVSDRRDFLVARIKVVTPWGDLVFPAEEALAGYHFWFYQLPLKYRSSLYEISQPWEIVASNNQFLFVVVIAIEEPAANLLPIPREHIGAIPLQVLEQHLEEAELELEALLAERQALTRKLTLLRSSMSEAATQAELHYAQQQTKDDEEMFVLQGWVDEKSIEEITNYAKKTDMATLIEEPAWNETPPTLLKDTEEHEAGVDLALFYQVPSYRSWDPSLFLAVSFPLFFAMILADAGYGLVLLVGLFAFWKHVGTSPKLKSWRQLVFITSLASIAYGIVIGSYFGVAPSEGSSLAHLHLLNLNDFDTMMKISIVIGVIHIVYANVMTSWVNRKHRNVIASLGWIGIFTGGLLLWLSGQQGIQAQIAVTLIATGGFGVLLFTSLRPIIKPTDWLWRLFDGVKGLAGIMGAFGDVLSYMRLFALGLASASLALTFNQLALDAKDAIPGTGIVVFLLILVIGHVLNFGLALMAGVVHGLRLNYIEFYNWAFQEEGIAFRAFARNKESKNE